MFGNSSDASGMEMGAISLFCANCIKRLYWNRWQTQASWQSRAIRSNGVCTNFHWTNVQRTMDALLWAEGVFYPNTVYNGTRHAGCKRCGWIYLGRVSMGINWLMWILAQWTFFSILIQKMASIFCKTVKKGSIHTV